MGININSNYIPAININTGISISGILSVSSNSFYGVTNYQALIIKPEDLLETRLIAPSLITNYSNNSLTYIASYAFSGTGITTANFPTCTSIGTGAFNGCTALTSANFPICPSAAYGAFYGCANLSSVSFPACTSINYGAFSRCRSLTSVNFPACTTVDGMAFHMCSTLARVNFPACTSIGNAAFSSCALLTSVNFPICRNIRSGAFYSCYSLTSVNFPACTRIGNSAFQNCYNLIKLYLGSSFCSLDNITAFQSTPISNYTASTGGVYGSIYVPSSLLTTYQSATNWATYSSRFVGI